LGYVEVLSYVLCYHSGTTKRMTGVRLLAGALRCFLLFITSKTCRSHFTSYERATKFKTTGV